MVEQMACGFVYTFSLTSTSHFSVLDTEKSLHSAAKDNDVEKIKSLLANKLDVNARNNVSETLNLASLILMLTCISF